MGSCSDDFGAIQVTHNLAATYEYDEEEGFTCEYVLNDDENIFITEGIFDLTLMTQLNSETSFTGYVMKPILRNMYPSNIVRGVERNNIEIDSVEIEEIYLVGGLERFRYKETRKANITIEAESRAFVTLKLLDLEILKSISNAYETDGLSDNGSRVFIQFNITFKGHTVGGKDIVSNVFEYSAKVCEGCLFSKPPTCIAETEVDGKTVTVTYDPTLWYGCLPNDYPTAWACVDPYE